MHRPGNTVLFGRAKTEQREDAGSSHTWLYGYDRGRSDAKRLQPHELCPIPRTVHWPFAKTSAVGDSYSEHRYGRHVRVADVEVSGKAGRTLVGLLLHIGRDADLALAHRIERGYSRQNATLELSATERDHLLSALDDPPSELVELRDGLARENDQS